MNGEISLSKRNLSGLVKGSFSTLDVKSLQVKDNFDIHSNQIKLTDGNQTSHSQVLALDINRHITTVDKINDLSFGNVVDFENSITLPRSLPVGGSIQFPKWPIFDLCSSSILIQLISDSFASPLICNSVCFCAFFIPGGAA